MQYYRLAGGGDDRLAVADGNALYDLTSAAPRLTSFLDLVRVADVVDESIEELGTALCRRADRLDPGQVEDATTPLVPDEVWAAGVTYEISEAAREAESSKPEIYLDVYEGERPELFFKATANRTVGPDDAVGIRADSDWDVPEPELAIIVYQGDIVGFTAGNDMSSRSIEGENPLYLPQAKVYDRSCAIGPCAVPASAIENPHDLGISMSIRRGDEEVFEGETSTAEMVRSCEELVSYFVRHNTVPETAVIMTGTSLVPPDDFTLRQDDVVRIDIEGIGALENPVTTV